MVHAYSFLDDIIHDELLALALVIAIAMTSEAYCSSDGTGNDNLVA